MEKIIIDPIERQWAMFAHLAALAAFVIPVGHIVGPLIVYLIKKDEYEFVRDQGKEVLNFQITWTLIFIISAVLIFVLVGIFLLVGFGIAWLILIIIGATKANVGVFYKYPLTIKFIN
jgi:uncharacterized protein